MPDARPKQPVITVPHANISQSNHPMNVAELDGRTKAGSNRYSESYASKSTAARVERIASQVIKERETAQRLLGVPAPKFALSEEVLFHRLKGVQSEHVRHASRGSENTVTPAAKLKQLLIESGKRPSAVTVMDRKGWEVGIEPFSNLSLQDSQQPEGATDQVASPESVTGAERSDPTALLQAVAEGDNNIKNILAERSSWGPGLPLGQSHAKPPEGLHSYEPPHHNHLAASRGIVPKHWGGGQSSASKSSPSKVSRPNSRVDLRTSILSRPSSSQGFSQDFNQSSDQRPASALGLQRPNSSQSASFSRPGSPSLNDSDNYNEDMAPQGPLWDSQSPFFHTRNKVSPVEVGEVVHGICAQGHAREYCLQTPPNSERVAYTLRFITPTLPIRDLRAFIRQGRRATPTEYDDCSGPKGIGAGLAEISALGSHGHGNVFVTIDYNKAVHNFNTHRFSLVIEINANTEERVSDVVNRQVYLQEASNTDNLTYISGDLELDYFQIQKSPRRTVKRPWSALLSSLGGNQSIDSSQTQPRRTTTFGQDPVWNTPCGKGSPASWLRQRPWSAHDHYEDLIDTMEYDSLQTPSPCRPSTRQMAAHKKNMKHAAFLAARKAGVPWPLQKPKSPVKKVEVEPKIKFLRSPMTAGARSRASSNVASPTTGAQANHDAGKAEEYGSDRNSTGPQMNEDYIREGAITPNLNQTSHQSQEASHVQSKTQLEQLSDVADIDSGAPHSDSGGDPHAARRHLFEFARQMDEAGGTTNDDHGIDAAVQELLSADTDSIQLRDWEQRLEQANRQLALVANADIELGHFAWSKSWPGHNNDTTTNQAAREKESTGGPLKPAGTPAATPQDVDGKMDYALQHAGGGRPATIEAELQRYEAWAASVWSRAKQFDQDIGAEPMFGSPPRQDRLLSPTPSPQRVQRAQTLSTRDNQVGMDGSPTVSAMTIAAARTSPPRSHGGGTLGSHGGSTGVKAATGTAVGATTSTSTSAARLRPHSASSVLPTTMHRKQDQPSDAENIRALGAQVARSSVPRLWDRHRDDEKRTSSDSNERRRSSSNSQVQAAGSSSQGVFKGTGTGGMKVMVRPRSGDVDVGGSGKRSHVTRASPKKPIGIAVVGNPAPEVEDISEAQAHERDMASKYCSPSQPAPFRKSASRAATTPVLVRGQRDRRVASTSTGTSPTRQTRARTPLHVASIDMSKGFVSSHVVSGNHQAIGAILRGQDAQPVARIVSQGHLPSHSAQLLPSDAKIEDHITTTSSATVRGSEAVVNQRPTTAGSASAGKPIGGRRGSGGTSSGSGTVVVKVSSTKKKIRPQSAFPGTQNEAIGPWSGS